MSAQLADATQLALGVVAARHRGDPEGAQQLLREFGSDGAAATGFLLVAELALALVRSQTGQTAEELVQELSLLVGTTLAEGC